ncbi:SseB family protein [Frankia sp. Mgl5]|uniref:SseB family protein n=1 Tax=Frankia sp. Mgl5 TaxID=2933793 RepID=UPI00200E1D45|nr:SseB family protein [Frankia sp. Mgl5]MCK9930403.1 SseB family protein [Frankia sp. Mgl5]
MSPDLLTPPGQGDHGRADSALLAALRSGDRAALTAALPGARVFVGVEARALATDALTGADKKSDMVLVTLRTPSGSGALPVFSAVDVMAAWRPSVRPVPVTLPDACAEAVRMGLAAVVIDLGGPAPVTLDVRPAAGDVGGGVGRRGPRPFGGGEGMWISSGEPGTSAAVRGAAGPAAAGADGHADELIVAADSGGGLLRPRPVPLGARGRRRIRAALAGLPPETEVWPAELAESIGQRWPARPVLAVAVNGAAGTAAAAVDRGHLENPGDTENPDAPGDFGGAGDFGDTGAAGGAAPGGDDMITEIVRRLRLLIEDGSGGSAAGGGSAEAAVLVVDPTEVPAVRAHLGRGVRPPRRSLFRRRDDRT